MSSRRIEEVVDLQAFMFRCISIAIGRDENVSLTQKMSLRKRCSELISLFKKTAYMLKEANE